MDTAIAPARALPDPKRSAKRRGPRAEKHLSQNEVRVLAVLRAGTEEGPALAKKIGVQVRSIYVILARMVEKGLVRQRVGGWYEIVPPKPIGAETVAKATDTSEPSIIRPIPEWRRMAGR